MGLTVFPQGSTGNSGDYGYDTSPVMLNGLFTPAESIESQTIEAADSGDTTVALDSIAAELSLAQSLPATLEPIQWGLNDLFQSQDDNQWGVFSRVGGELVPLPRLATDGMFGIPNIEGFTHDGLPPWVAFNSSVQPVSPFGGVEWPGGDVAMHPGPGVGVGVSWRAPGDGVLELDGTIRDGHPRGGDGVSYLLELVTVDGILVVSQGTIGPGGSADFPDRPISLAVLQGDRIRLTILAEGTTGNPGEYSCDTTFVGFRGHFTPITLMESQGREAVHPDDISLAARVRQLDEGVFWIKPRLYVEIINGIRVHAWFQTPEDRSLILVGREGNTKSGVGDGAYAYSHHQGGTRDGFVQFDMRRDVLNDAMLPIRLMDRDYGNVLAEVMCKWDYQSQTLTVMNEQEQWVSADRLHVPTNDLPTLMPDSYPHVTDEGMQHILRERAMEITGLSFDPTRAREYAMRRHPELFGKDGQSDIQRLHELAGEGRDHGYWFYIHQRRQRDALNRAAKGITVAQEMVGNALLEAMSHYLKGLMGLRPPYTDDKVDRFLHVHRDGELTTYVDMPNADQVRTAVKHHFDEILALQVKLSGKQTMQERNQTARLDTLATTGAETTSTSTQPNDVDDRQAHDDTAVGRQSSAAEKPIATTNNFDDSHAEPAYDHRSESPGAILLKHVAERLQTRLDSMTLAERVEARRVQRLLALHRSLLSVPIEPRIATTETASSSTSEANTHIDQLQKELTDLWEAYADVQQALADVTAIFDRIDGNIASAEQFVSSVKVTKDLGPTYFRLLRNATRPGDFRALVVDPIIQLAEAGERFPAWESDALVISEIITAPNPYAAAIALGFEIGEIGVDYIQMKVNKRELASIKQLTDQINRINTAIELRQRELIELQNES